MEWIKYFRFRYWFPKKGSISYAIKNAPPNSRIYLEPGIYDENIELRDGISLVGMKETKDGMD